MEEYELWYSSLLRLASVAATGAVELCKLHQASNKAAPTEGKKMRKRNIASTIESIYRRLNMIKTERPELFPVLPNGVVDETV